VKENEITLGSLFDGIGAVPYAASFFGIKTLWASEILPNAVSVTKRHFPDMEHLGDITKLNGGELPPVKIIAFGSPCQSFSVAGDRKSFEGKSVLIFEAIRIIKEMRCATNGRYPEIVLFENVPGLLNVDKRRSYKTVLEAFTETEIPMPESGRWANAGMVRGRGIDLAWVIKDSQYYRTAQRRKRLFLVVDFVGQRAGEILFVSKSLSGYFEAREIERERIAADAKNGSGNTGVGIGVFMAGQAKNARSIAYSESVSPTLKGSPSGLNQVPCICKPHIAQKEAATVYGICSDSSNSMKSSNSQSGIYKAETCRTLDRNCGNPGCNQGGMIIVEPQSADLPQSFTMRLREGCAGGGKGPLIQTEKSGTLAAGNDQYLFCPAYCLQGNMIGRKDENGPMGSGVNEEISFAITAADRHAVAAVDCRNLSESEISGTLQSKCTGGYSLNYLNPVRIKYIVRRLTPTEAERLMSLPDSWTEYGHDGKIMSDSARYQMCGNSIVVNCLAYIMQNIAEVLSLEH